MSEKRIDIVTESMFYVLMAFTHGEGSGVDAASFTERITNGRVHLGPATLYTILGRFVNEGILEEIRTDGRKHIYRLTDQGRIMYEGEIDRMSLCMNDAERCRRGSIE